MCKFRQEIRKVDGRLEKLSIMRCDHSKCPTSFPNLNSGSWERILAFNYKRIGEGEIKREAQ